MKKGFLNDFYSIIIYLSLLLLLFLHSYPFENSLPPLHAITPKKTTSNYSTINICYSINKALLHILTWSTKNYSLRYVMCRLQLFFYFTNKLSLTCLLCLFNNLLIDEAKIIVGKSQIFVVQTPSKYVWSSLYTVSLHD